MSAVEKFPVLLSEAEEESSAVPPCFSHEGINVSSPCTSLELRISISDVVYLVSVHPTQQPLPPCSNETEYQCRGDLTILTQNSRGIYRIL